MSPSLLKNWFATGTILSSFSVNCQCFLRGLSPVFRTMSPITSTPWKASWMLTTSIHLLQSMHWYSTCSELYAWSVSEINAQAQWKSFCSVIIHHHTHPWRPRGGQSGRETRRDKSFQAQAEKPLGTDSHWTISKWSSECWLLIGHKKCFVLFCPIGEQHLLSSFRELVHDGYWHALKKCMQSGIFQFDINATFQNTGSLYTRA